MVPVGIAMAAARDDIVYPEQLPRKRKRWAVGGCGISRSTLDPNWLPTVAQMGWTIITRDRHIQSRPAEIRAVYKYGAKMVVLTTAGNLTRWEQLRIIARQWDKIVDFHEHVKPPRIKEATKTVFRDLS